LSGDLIPPSQTTYGPCGSHIAVEMRLGFSVVFPSLLIHHSNCLVTSQKLTDALIAKLTYSKTDNKQEIIWFINDELTDFNWLAIGLESYKTKSEAVLG
jgi:hypothetical protein